MATIPAPPALPAVNSADSIGATLRMFCMNLGNSPAGGLYDVVNDQLAHQTAIAPVGMSTDFPANWGPPPEWQAFPHVASGNAYAAYLRSGGNALSFNGGAVVRASDTTSDVLNAGLTLTAFGIFKLERTTGKQRTYSLFGFNGSSEPFIGAYVSAPFAAPKLCIRGNPGLGATASNVPVSANFVLTPGRYYAACASFDNTSNCLIQLFDFVTGSAYNEVLVIKNAGNTATPPGLPGPAHGLGRVGRGGHEIRHGDGLGEG
jgi:hypothetical protein